MSSLSYNSQNKADRWSSPRPHTDADLRRRKYGRVRPMEEPSWLERLLGR